MQLFIDSFVVVGKRGFRDHKDERKLQRFEPGCFLYELDHFFVV